ncbi:MAG: glycosyltransferase family 4 protein [Propionibacteriaceae bacterium]
MTTPRRLRVLVLDHTALLSGAEVALARLLASLDLEQFHTEVLLFSPGPLAERLRAAGVGVDVALLRDDLVQLSRTELLRRPDRMLAAVVALLRYVARLRVEIRRRRPDLVVTNSLKSAVLGGLASRLAGVPWVWHLHDRLSADYLPGPVAAALRFLARVGPRRVVVNSLDSAARLGHQPRGHVVVAYPGLPADAFRSVPGRTEVDAGRPILGMLGRISATKGQLEFLRAAAEVARSHPDVAFRVIGRALFNDQPYAEELQTLITRLGLGDRVELVGWAADPTAALAELTAVVHASPVPEPFGQVVVEAMAAGVPVIATLAGGVGEILDPDGVIGTVATATAVRTPYGQVVGPGDVAGLAAALRWVLDHPVEAAELAGRARELAAERFRIETTVEVVGAAWRRAVASRAP